MKGSFFFLFYIYKKQNKLGNREIKKKQKKTKRQMSKRFFIEKVQITDEV